MKTRYLTALVVAAGLSCSFAMAADVGVSINIGQPGFYGRIDIGNAPPPVLIYTEPVWINRVAVAPAPIYLRVPPGHEKKWAKHCRKYGACGRPVFFVRDEWYRDVYAPHYREHGHDRAGARGDDGDHRGKGKGKGKDKGKHGQKND